MPLLIPKKAQNQVLPVIDENKAATVTQDVGDELADINESNLRSKTEKFSGVLPNGMLEMYVVLLGGKARICVSAKSIKIFFYSKILL